MNDAEHFRELGIEAGEAADRGYSRLLRSALWLLGGVVSGVLIYGALLTAAWALRALGVTITGI